MLVLVEEKEKQRLFKYTRKVMGRNKGGSSFNRQIRSIRMATWQKG